MGVSLPPRKKESSEVVISTNKGASEKKIRDVINKGGSTTKASHQTDLSKEQLKGINVKFTVSEIDAIKVLRDIRPAGKRNGKISVSLHDWIVEAVQEKIKRDMKKSII
ncbi:MAG: hypothetical protein MUF58_22720 [Arcicella sp.]|jgi:hypothetical protein|nr:hypothetical protein [Arcicella sp.]